MTENEINQLKGRFAELLEVENKKADFLIATDTALDEDSGQFYLTVAEMQVFQIDPDCFHALRLAYSGFEVLADLTADQGVFPAEVEALIIKARDICPPAKWFDYEQPFMLRCDNEAWFSWFAKTFFDLSNRQAHAYYAKRGFNLSGVARFGDEEDG